MRDRHGLAGRDADEAEVEDRGLVDVELADARPGDQEDHVAHHQAEPDGHQRRGDQAAAGERLQHGDSAGRPRGAPCRRRRRAVATIRFCAEHRVEQEADIGAEGQVFAMGEVGDALDAEDERGPDAGQRQDRAGDDAVDRRAGRVAAAPATQLTSDPAGNARPAGTRSWRSSPSRLA